MRGFLSWVLGILVGLSGFPVPARGEDPPKTETTKKAGETYQEIVAEFEKAMQEFYTAHRAAKTDEERKRVSEKHPRAEQYAPRFLALAERAPRDPAAIDCLLWVATRCWTGEEREKAIRILVEDHIGSEKLEQVCQALYYTRSASSEKYLRTILEKSPHASVQGQACLRLAQQLKDSRPAESEKLLGQVVEKYGEIAGGRRTLGDQARGELFEIRNLAIGKVAPEIEGEDLQGEKFKLSDYRGKVVVLDFWGNW
jgi:hypothetical protein